MERTPARTGRPRSEQAREAVLHAVDDLLLEVGYAALTMKGIAERAGVGRQTVYRWWSNKAEILLEASASDAADELSVAPTGSPQGDVTAYLEALVVFLSHSPPGIAFRALVAAAQHDAEVAQLISARDVLGDSARIVLARLEEEGTALGPPDRASALLIGPVFFWIMSGRDASQLDAGELARDFLRAVSKT